MTTELYIHCVIASLLGVMFHVSVKIKSLYEDHKRANLKFSVGKYFSDDWIALIVDIIAALVLVYLVDEWLDADSRLLNKIKSIFFFVGFTGSYVILQILSVAKSRFRKSIDEKTNTADAATGDLHTPTPTIK
jgi:hypothetical protein